MNNKHRKEYLAFLKKQLEDKCNSDMCCEIYWDYRDELDASILKEVVDNYKEKGYVTPKDYLWDKLLELNFDYDNYMFNEIRKEIQGCDNENIVKYFNEYGDLYEDAIEVGYNGIDVNLDTLLDKSEFCVNVMFATNTERNYDMGSIVNAFGCWRKPYFDYLLNNVDDLDNALTYLIHQQGHSVKEVYECLLNNPIGFGCRDKLDFAKSVVNDIVNNSSDALSELTALIKLDGNEFFELLEAVEKEEKYLTFRTDTEIGIFNEWSGCGGLLEIQLDKPFVVPASMVRNVQIEGAKDNFGCTVYEVYGLIGSCWKDALGYTDEKPSLFEEDLQKTVEYAKALFNPFELETFSGDGDIIATIRNNTNFTLRFSFRNFEGCNFGLSPKSSTDLYYDQQGVTTLDALEAGEFSLEIIE